MEFLWLMMHYVFIYRTVIILKTQILKSLYFHNLGFISATLMVELFAVFIHFFAVDDGRWNVNSQQEMRKRKKCWKKEINILWKLLPSWICKIWKLSSAWKRSLFRHLFYCCKYFVPFVGEFKNSIRFEKFAARILVGNGFREKRKFKK